MAADIEVRVSETFTVRFDAGITGLTPGVKVMNDAGAVVIARDTGFVEDADAPGLYIKTDVDAPATAGTFIVVIDTGEPTPDYAYLELKVRPQASVLDVPDGFPALADILAASDVDELTDADETQQETWYTISRKLIERFCNQRFDLDENLTLAIDGNGGRRVALPRRLATLSEASVAGTGLDASDLTLSPEHDAIGIGSISGSTWVERAMWDGPRIFPTGVGIIEITGDWGWTAEELAATPLLIAMKIDMESQALVHGHGLVGSVRAATRMGVGSISEGPLRADVEAPDVVLAPEAMALLEDLVWQPAPVVA